MLSSSALPRSVSQAVWEALGCPPLAAKHQPEDVPPDTPCATCGRPTAQAVPVTQIETSTFTRHAENLRFSRYICPACAWFYGHTKAKGMTSNRSFWVQDGSVVWPTFAPHPDRVTWKTLLPTMTPRCYGAGLMTADTKPRLWPLVEFTSQAAVYVHALHYDISQRIALHPQRTDDLVQRMSRLLAQGVTKSELRGQWKTPARYLRWRHEADAMQVAARRDDADFIPALLMAYAEE